MTQISAGFVPRANDLYQERGLILFKNFLGRLFPARPVSSGLDLSRLPALFASKTAQEFGCDAKEGGDLHLGKPVGEVGIDLQEGMEAVLGRRTDVLQQP